MNTQLSYSEVRACSVSMSHDLSQIHLTVFYKGGSHASGTIDAYDHTTDSEIPLIQDLAALLENMSVTFIPVRITPAGSATFRTAHSRCTLKNYGRSVKIITENLPAAMAA